MNNYLKRLRAYYCISCAMLVLGGGLFLTVLLILWRTGASWHSNRLLCAFDAVALCCALFPVGFAAVLLRLQRDFRRLQQDLAVQNARLMDANIRLAHRAAEHAAIFASMSDGVLLVDAQKRLLSWNPAFFELSGLTEDQIYAGMPIDEVLHLFAADLSDEQIDIITEDQPSDDEHHMLPIRFVGTHDGRVVELRRRGLPDGGRVSLIVDATEHLRALETMRRAGEEKSRFVAIVSHEIRTPLGAAVDCFDMLQQTPLTIEQRALISAGRQASGALMSLLNDILDLTKLEVGRLAVAPSPTELRPLLGGVIDLFRPAAARRQVELRLEIAPEIPDWVMIDAGRVRQILMNFVANAAKFALPGPAALCARIVDCGPGPMLRLSVADGGPAIAPQDRDLMFRPFVQLGEAGPPGGAGLAPGAGLGLAISRMLAELMGGMVGYAENGESGKEFWFCMPLRVSQPPAAPLSDPEDASAGRETARVLLVEDSPASRKLLAARLRRAGHRVVTADHVAGVWPLLRGGPYDIMITDFHLPDGSGLDIIRALRSRDDALRTLPVVILTADATLVPEELAELSISEALLKPVDPNFLLALIERLALPPTPPEPASANPTPQQQPMVLSGPRMEQARAGLSPTIWGALVEQCVTDLREGLTALSKEGLSCREAYEIGHSLCGLAGNYGLVQIESTLRALTAAAKSDDPSWTRWLAETQRTATAAINALEGTARSAM